MPCPPSVPSLHLDIMVTVQQAGLVYWQSSHHHHLLPTAYTAAIPCQWHHTAVAAAATSATAIGAEPNAATHTRRTTPPPPLAQATGVPPPPLPTAQTALASATSYLTAQQHSQHGFSPSPVAATPEMRQIATVEPEQPIGYGSFGVVW